MDTVYSILKKKFGLRDSHMVIIKALDKRVLSADEICRYTKIPHGRVYDYLNKLIDFGIVEKHGRKPASYTITDLKKNLLWFMKNRIDVMIQSQSEVMGALRHGQSNEVEILDSSLKFTQAHIKMLEEAKVFRYMSVHLSLPYVLYPENVDDFLRMRKIVAHARPTITNINPEVTLLICRSYLDALKKGKRIVVIFEKESLDFHLKLLKKWLGKKKFFDTIRNVVEKFSKYDLEAYVIDEYNPMQIDVNERRLCLSLNYVGVTNGIVVTNKDAVDFMNQVFDAKINRAKNVVPILKNILNS